MTAKKAPSSGGKLTPQQEAFAAGIAQGMSQSDAYRLAFPKAEAWKDETVWSRASELASSCKVQGRVQELLQKAVDANEVTVERIIAEVAKIAFGDMRRVMTWGPGGVLLNPSDELSDTDAAMVSEVSETGSPTNRSLKLKTHDKMSALRLLADIKGAIVRKNEHTGKDGAPIAPPVFNISFENGGPGQ